MDRLLSQKHIGSFVQILDAQVASGMPVGHCIDGGAAGGHTATRIVERLSDKELCYAFEPFEGNHRFFEGLDKRIVLRKEALAERKKTSSFATSSTVNADSELGQRGMAGYSAVGKLIGSPTPAAVKVQCVAADNVIPRKHTIGFVKLDIQGGELDALKGMQRIMKSVNFMWIEFSNQPGLLDFLREHDFHMFDTEYFFNLEPSAAMKQDFLIDSESLTLSTGKPAWFGFRKQEWRDYEHQFELMKFKYGLGWTDIVCVPKAKLESFRAMIQQYPDPTIGDLEPEDGSATANMMPTRADLTDSAEIASRKYIVTGSDEWQAMSDCMAGHLWTHPARIEQPASQFHAASERDFTASEHQAHVNLVLRLFEKEGFIFRKDETNVLLPSSKEWWTQTARFAWLLWLQFNRKIRRVPIGRELEVWRDEAEAYRIYVRDAIRMMAADGILLQR